MKRPPERRAPVSTPAKGYLPERGQQGPRTDPALHVSPGTYGEAVPEGTSHVAPGGPRKGRRGGTNPREVEKQKALAFQGVNTKDLARAAGQRRARPPERNAKLRIVGNLEAFKAAKR